MKENLIINLDKVIHQKARLGIMSILIVKEEVDFNHLKAQLELTDGNLSTHLSHLEKAKYVKIKKKFVKKKPQTLCRLTENGRQAFLKYINNLEKIIQKIPQE
jgi:DNA-binding MarR family transcriptional regulator